MVTIFFFPQNSGIFWKATVAVCADVGTFLQELSLFLVDYKCSPEWLQQLQEKDAVKEEQNREVCVKLQFFNILENLER